MESGDPSNDESLRTVDGRLPGRRGRATRTRLLEVTAEMLRTRSYRDLAVVDIAREAGVSPATFYQYFPDVETAIFFIADHIVVDGEQRLTELVEAMDLGQGPDAAMEGARALADGFLDFWREFFSILRILDLGAAEKDARFQQRRTQLLRGPTEALAAALDHQRASGVVRPDLDPRAMAAVLVSMLSHVAAHRTGLRDWGVPRDALVESMAHVLYWTYLDAAPPTPAAARS